MAFKSNAEIAAEKKAADEKAAAELEAKKKQDADEKAKKEEQDAKDLIDKKNKALEKSPEKKEPSVPDSKIKCKRCGLSFEVKKAKVSKAFQELGCPECGFPVRCSK
jgi:ribosomal protein L37E